MSGTRKLRVALLGAGRIAGLVHAPILARQADVTLVAVADADPVARDRAARHAPGAVRFADWRRAIDLGGLDAAVICLPPAMHAPAACASFSAGLHVYVEKPLALDLEEADAMIAARDAAARLGMVGLNFRFHPLVEDAHRRVRAGELGQLLAVRSLMTSARRPLPEWKRDRGAGGGALADLGTHHVDLVAHLSSQEIDVKGLHVEERRTSCGSLATLAGRLADGTPLQIMVAQTTGQSCNVVQLLGERGHLTIDLAEATPRPLETPPGRLARIARARTRLRALAPRALLAAPGHDPSFGRALDAFVTAAREGAPSVRPDLADGRRALAAVLAAEHAAGRVPALAAE
jgi:predicted dehydrogenase